MLCIARNLYTLGFKRCDPLTEFNDYVKKYRKKFIEKVCDKDYAKVMHLRILYNIFNDIVNNYLLKDPLITSSIDSYTNTCDDLYHIEYSFYTCNEEVTLPLNYKRNYNPIQHFEYTIPHKYVYFDLPSYIPQFDSIRGPLCLFSLGLIVIKIVDPDDNVNEIRIYDNTTLPNIVQHRDILYKCLALNKDLDDALTEFSYYQNKIQYRFMCRLSNKQTFQLVEDGYIFTLDEMEA